MPNLELIVLHSWDKTLLYILPNAKACESKFASLCEYLALLPTNHWVVYLLLWVVSSHMLWLAWSETLDGDPLQTSRAQLFLWYPDLPMNTSSTFWVLALTQVVEPTNSLYFPLPMPHRGNFFKAWSWTWNCWTISRIRQFYSFSGISTLCCPMLSI